MSKVKVKKRNKYFPQMLISPSFIIIFGVFIIPIVYSLVTSVCNYNLAERTFEFAGMKNYAAMFADKYFINSMKLTLVFTVVSVFAEITLGIGVAIVLNQKFVGRGFVRGLMILPWALPSVVNAVMWKWILNGNYGVLNALLMKLGILSEPYVWLGQKDSAFLCMLIVNIWKETPYVVLLTIAALANIPEDVYEAAKIDGSNAWKSFWTITLPMIKPVVLILTITKTIWALQTFDLVHILTSGGPAAGTELLSFYIHKNTFKFLDFGYGSAMSYTLAIICFVLTLIYIKAFMDSDTEDGGAARKKRRARL